MKSFAWLVLAAVACVELHGVPVLGQAADEIDDTITTAFAVQEVIACDGTIKPCGSSKGGPVCTSLGKIFSSKCEFENSYCENPRDDNYIVDCFTTHSVVDGEGDDGDGDGEGSTDGISKSAFDVPIEIDQPESPNIAFADADVAVESDEPHESGDSDAVSDTPIEKQEPKDAPVESEEPFTDPVTDTPVESEEPFTDPVAETPIESEEPFTDPVQETPGESDPHMETSDPPAEPSAPSDEPVESSDPPAESSDPPTAAPSTAPAETEQPTDPGKVRIDAVIKCNGNIRPCPRGGKPVCTSYGKTFSSHCEYENAYCESPSDDFYVLYDHPCEEKDIPFSVLSANLEEETIWATVFDVKIELDDDAVLPVKTTKVDCSSGRVACSGKYEPVCTSYGRTYMNECHFNNAFCEKPKKDFYIVSKGKCTNQYQVQDLGDEETDGDILSPDVIDVPIEIDEVEVDMSGGIACGNQKKPNAYCSLVCKTGEVDVKPVCGSDAQSYINDCHLLSAKCENPKLEKAYDGLCVVYSKDSRASTLSFNTQATSNGNVVSAAKPKCNPRCGKTYLPVCGSNSVTYANECLLDYAACVNPLLTKLSDGKCPDFHEPKSDASKSHESSCVPPVCSSTDAPVCGTDGETYANVCLLQVAQCQNRGLTVLHNGPCDADTTLTCATLACPLHTECREEPGTQVAYCAEVCHPDRCSANETCKLLDSECFTAPCSPVATCVANSKKRDNDF